MNIKKREIINRDKLSNEFYFNSILQEAYADELLSESDIENIQLQCIELLAYKCKKYNRGESSSIREETAANIMKSNLFTIGLFLKSLSDAECAVQELKTTSIFEIYKKGRELINVKINSANHLYYKVKSNKIVTQNYTYNATLETGIDSFFEMYNPDYEAYEVSASIDYQLCNPVEDFVGIEFMQKYLENLYLENEFCGYFDPIKIHHLLSGYDEGYKDLLINIFEQVLTAALGCKLARHSVLNLDLKQDEIIKLYYELSEDDDELIALKIDKAAENLLQDLAIKNSSLSKLMAKSLPKITTTIIQAVRTNTLSKTVVSPSNPELKPRIKFLSGVKMDDKKYREFLGELLACRYLSDKLAMIKDNIKSFEDFEDLLLDASFDEEEVFSVLDILGDIEIAALIKRHPYLSEIQAIDLTETEYVLRKYLKAYFDQLKVNRQKQIIEIIGQLIDD